MAEKMTPEIHVPWYLRIKTLIIAAGGLAAAIVSIITLANLIGPRENTNDEARIESVTRRHPMTLAEFNTEKLGGELPLQPAPRSSRKEPSVPELPLTVEFVEPSPSTPTPDSTPNPSDTPEPTGTPSAIPPAATTESVAQKLKTDGRLVDYDVALADLAALPATSPILRPSPGPQPPGKLTTLPIETLSPDEVVERLLAALAKVEGVNSAHRDPRGYLYVVDLSIKGFVGEKLMLTYSLDPTEGGSKVPESWNATNLAYYVTPTTQSDTGVAEIWIPDLKAPGPYAVNAELRLVEEDLLLDSEISEPLKD